MLSAVRSHRACSSAPAEFGIAFHHQRALEEQGGRRRRDAQQAPVGGGRSGYRSATAARGAASRSPRAQLHAQRQAEVVTTISTQWQTRPARVGGRRGADQRFNAAVTAARRLHRHRLRRASRAASGRQHWRSASRAGHCSPGRRGASRRPARPGPSASITADGVDCWAPRFITASKQSITWSKRPKSVTGARGRRRRAARVRSAIRHWRAPTASGCR